MTQAARRRQPGVEVAVAAAEDLPFPDDAFDATLAQLVVPFMHDPAAGLAEMARVTRDGGVVAACVWDHAGEGPLSVFWRAVRELDRGARDESGQPGAGEGQLTVLFRAAGLHDVRESALYVRVRHASFDDWWAPFTLGVGPAGAYVKGLGTDVAAELRERCRLLLGGAPGPRRARAAAARGLA
ncbi:MAG: class I SAM-dependent methyltransferase [Actinomycetota bacterium]|nr:class I SAM-dependent methyltransferase [Actinomycetota bacterium]